jgi:hypothetical protein
LGRVLQGGHFASDVLFAGLFIWGVAQLLRQALLHARLRRWRRTGSPHEPASEGRSTRDDRPVTWRGRHASGGVTASTRALPKLKP